MASERRYLGTAGASADARARAIRERRRAEAVRRGRLRTLLFGGARNSQLRVEERNWGTGAEGERQLARELARRCPGVHFLHDRRAPMSRTNIDHIAVTPNGVYVIDCKRYKGRIEVVTPLFGQPRLKIAGRDRTRLIDGLEKQVAHVRAALGEREVPVHGCLCFVAPAGLLSEVGLPAFRTLKIRRYPLYHTRKLARALKRSGPLSQKQTHELAAQLAERLPAAAMAPRPDAAA